MNRLTRSLLALLVLPALACETQTAEQTGATEETVATDAAAAEQQIEEGSTAWEQALLANDAAAITAIYTDDAILLPPGAPRTAGTTNVRAVFDEWLGASTVTEAALETDAIVVAEAGDIAYRTGTFTMTGTTADGQTWEDEGKFVEIWHNVDGQWKIAVDAWNQDVPPGTAPAEGMAPAEGTAGETPPADPTPAEADPAPGT